MIYQFHVYVCCDCNISFAVEDHESVDHSSTLCPTCQGELIDEVGHISAPVEMKGGGDVGAIK